MSAYISMSQHSRSVSNMIRYCESHHISEVCGHKLWGWGRTWASLNVCVLFCIVFVLCLEDPLENEMLHLKGLSSKQYISNSTENICFCLWSTQTAAEDDVNLWTGKDETWCTSSSKVWPSLNTLNTSEENEWTMTHQNNGTDRHTKSSTATEREPERGEM